MHGVSEVEGGSRYTMPGWYTRDITPGSIRVGRTVRLTLAPLTASLGGQRTHGRMWRWRLLFPAARAFTAR